MRMRRIYNKTFNQSFYIFYGSNKKNVLKFFQKHDEEISIADSDYGFASEMTNGKIVVWTKEEDLPHLMHELLHAVSFTLQCRLIDFATQEETYCYLLSYLVGELFADKSER